MPALMAEAGLTHGGFYRHFTSKHQLVAEACSAAVAAMAEAMAGAVAASRQDGLGVAASRYLSIGHRDDPAHGCPLAALGSELARADEIVREAATEGLRIMVDVIARSRTGVSSRAATRDALAAFSTMIGALTLARIVTDARLSAAILRAAKTHLRASHPEGRIAAAAGSKRTRRRRQR